MVNAEVEERKLQDVDEIQEDVEEKVQNVVVPLLMMVGVCLR